MLIGLLMQCLIVAWFREIHNTSRYTKAMNWLVTKYKTGVKQESFMKANHWLETSGSQLDKPRLIWLMCYIWLTSIILCLGDAIWRHRSGSSLVQAMACRIKATSRYLSQCWLITSKVKWHLSTDNYTRDSFKSPWWQWMKYGLSLYTDT